MPDFSSPLDALTNPERLQALRRYNVIGTPQEHLDRITRLAGRLYDAPIALLTLLGEERQRFISALGTELDGVPARPSVCRYTIASEGATVVENLAEDHRFADEYYVTGDMHLRFYAGAAMITSDGHPIGTVCVYDVRPRSPDPALLDNLEDLAKMGMEALERDQFSVDERPELSQTVLDHLPGIFYVVDSDGAMERWNARFQDVSGYTSDELDGRPAASFFTGSDRTDVETAIKQVFETGSATVEARFTTKEGERIPMIFTGVRARIRNQPRLVGMGIDISERKRREEQLHEAKEEAETARREAEAARREAERHRHRAEEANRSKSRFLAGVAHDLKSPVSAIEGFARVLTRSLDDDRVEYAESIRRGATQISDMAEALMELSRLGAGGLDLDVSPVDATALLRGVSDDLATQADEAGMPIRVDAPETNVWVQADEQSLRRAVRNLAENALTYGSDGDRVTLRVRRATETADEAESGAGGETDEAGEAPVVIAVADTGPGIDPDFMDRLFEPFARDAPDTDGTGLGLAVTKELVEAMDGTIEVESTLGEGTTFSIRLPAASRPDAGTPNGAAASPENASREENASEEKESQAQESQAQES